MADLELSGTRLAYDRTGQGPPLVLVHGSWSDRRGWDAVFGPLGDSFEVLRYDRRGHSESGPAAGTLRDDVTDLIGLVEALGLGPSHLLGSSSGGRIVLEVAATRPDLVRALVAHEPPAVTLLPEGSPERRRAEQELASIDDVVALIDAGEHEDAARRFVDEVAFGSGAWERFPRFVRATFIRNAATFAEEQRDPEAGTFGIETLPQVGQPALITRGDQSPPWYEPIVARLLEVLPNSREHVYQGASHAPQATHPRELVVTVREFLGSAEV